MPIKAVLFDYGGTLDSDGEPWLDRFFPIYESLGLIQDKETFAKAFYGSDDNLPREHRLEGLGLGETLFLQTRGVLSRLGKTDLSAADAVTARLLADSRAAFARNRPLLERLSRQYRLGIVSNFYGNLASILRGEGLSHFFGAVCDSGVLGVQKPDAAIFRRALETLDCPPAEAVMVGDSLPRDIRGAEGLGLGHVWLRRPGSPPAPPCCLRGRTIETLTALPEALTALSESRLAASA